MTRTRTSTRHTKRGLKKAPAVNKTTNTGARAYQGEHSDGSQVVGLEDIRVAIYPSGNHWIAQGFEIDYTAQGKDVEDVKKAFENGLEATINQHLKVYGHIRNLLRFAPVDVRLEVLDLVFRNPEALTPTYSQLSIHNCAKPVNIEFVALPAAA